MSSCVKTKRVANQKKTGQSGDQLDVDYLDEVNNGPPSHIAPGS